MRLLVGLGNPTPEYLETRHNIGFMAIDAIVDRLELSPNWENNKKLKSLIYKTTDFIFAKPQTYMNDSGRAVQLIKQMFKVEDKDIWIFHDELDLPLGTFKIQFNRGAAGHNGIKSVIELIGSQELYRWRIGIGKIEDRPTADYVLDRFAEKEKGIVAETLNKVAESVQFAITKNDLIETMNKYN